LKAILPLQKADLKNPATVEHLENTKLRGMKQPWDCFCLCCYRK